MGQSLRKPFGGGLFAPPTVVIVFSKGCLDVHLASSLSIGFARQVEAIHFLGAPLMSLVFFCSGSSSGIL